MQNFERDTLVKFFLHEDFRINENHSIETNSNESGI